MEDEKESAVTGRARGGVAAAAKLTKNERTARARAGAATRWAQRPNAAELPRVLPDRSGVLNLAGMKLPCAVVQGPNGVQRVLTDTGITNAILGNRSGASKRLKKAAAKEGALLPLFLAPGQLEPFIDKELLDGPFKPIEYLDGDRVVAGYDASALSAACDVWLRAREAGKLQIQQLAKAQKAEILTRALAQTGIVALIDEVMGYEKDRPQNALQAYLEMVIRKELAAWAKKFPDEFFENIYKLKGWPWGGMKKNRYSVVAYYIRDLIYMRIGPSVLKELEEKSPKNEKGQRPNKLHQWLSDDLGIPLLPQHLHAVITLQRLALANGYGWKKFCQTVDQVLPKRGTNFELPFETTSPNAP